MKISKITTISLPRLIWLMLLVFTSCVEPYNPPVLNSNIDILVADGFLNTADSSATVQLSKATPLSHTGDAVPELNAFVRIEDENGNFYPLHETDGGHYILEKMNLNQALKYRLSIRTANDNEYASDLVDLKRSPPIDSISYGTNPKALGLSIYVNTHDPSANTQYYQWSYQETWEYNAGYYSSHKIKNGVVVLQDQAIYTCWKSEPSTEIYIASTTQLTQDAVRNFELLFLPKGSSKLGRKFSIEVQQRALTKEAYEFWLQLKKTTESLGGLFDPLPSEVLGNLRSTNDASKTVLGYFSGGYVSKKRIFIEFNDLPKELRDIVPPYCQVDSIAPGDIAAQLDRDLIGPYGSPAVIAWLYSDNPNCMDCRDAGGQPIRPEFWE